MRLFFKIFLTLSCLNLFLNAAFLENEISKAIKEKKLILLTIKSEVCPYCIKMKKEIFDVKDYREKINKQYVHVEMDSKDPTLPSALHVQYLPTNFILSPQKMEMVDEFAGYIEPANFIELLNEVYTQEVK